MSATNAVQATVRSFDPATGAGDALLDDGTVRAFAGGAFRRSGLRLLRSGQRVRLELGPDGVVSAVTISTFGPV